MTVLCLRATWLRLVQPVLVIRVVLFNGVMSRQNQYRDLSCRLCSQFVRIGRWVHETRAAVGRLLESKRTVAGRLRADCSPRV